MMRHRWTVVGALALSLTFAGCGGSSGGGSDGPDNPPPTTPPPTNPPPTDPPPGTGTIGLDQRPQNSSCLAWDPPVTSGSIRLEPIFGGHEFERPVVMLQAAGDNATWYIVDQNGTIERVGADNQPTLFADLSARVASAADNAGNEAGLLGMAFHPQFASNRRVFLSYTHRPASGQLVSRISEFSVSASGQFVADPERVLLTIVQPFSNHNGGNIAFGPDGYLYIGMGDGGSSGDPQNNSQRLSNLLGKMLRIDVNGSAPYAIPSDNPYAGGAICGQGQSGSQCAEIWAHGLRNPWRWSFDRQTGELWLGDVGQNAWEEINILTRGGNYGWRCREGAHEHNMEGCPTSGLIDPVAEYPHRLNGQSTGNQSVTGGYVYRGSARANGLWGRYLFSDAISGRIWAARAGTRTPELLLESGLSVASFGEGHDGELYVLGFGSPIHRIVFESSTASDSAPDLLSETGCVNPASPTEPASGLIGYSINAPFWSDGAGKERFVGLPNAATISIQATGHWDLPAGSVLMKNFRVGDRLVETRLFMRHDAEQWSGYSYAWNADQTEATRVRGGAERTLANGQAWIFPSEADCLTCHTAAAGRALGPITAQMNRDHHYAQTNRSGNQIRTLSAVSVLTPSQTAPDPATLPAMPDPANTSAPLTERARAWLHTNCSNCHRPNGTANSSMDLRYGTSLAATNTCNVVPSDNLGLSDMHLITPGSAARSMIVNRASRRDEHQMPPLGSNIVDEQGVALVSEWIATLTGCQ